jgi:RNA polymerase sigma-70 factor (ECF subfamily)
MPCAAMPYHGSTDPWAGLRALSGLVAESLAALGRQPAFALPQPPAPRQQPLSMQMGVDVTAPVSLPGRRRIPDEARVPPDGASQPSDPAVIDEQHVETWRLVTLAQTGDGEAFGLLYDRYVETVFRFVYYRVNDRGLAEDFTSETFLRALRRISTITYQGRDIGAWFVTIARNIVLDHMKSARHRLEITTGDTIEGELTAPSPETTVLEAMTSNRLMGAVRLLGDEQRECVLLRFMQGFSVSETAAVMGKNDGAIKALQHRAVRKLAEFVGEDPR